VSDVKSDVNFAVGGLYVYPVKSCAGVSLDEALLVETGLDLDRAWMVVDEGGRFVSQRELPRMALIQPRLRESDMILRAPGMLALHIAYDIVEGPVTATVWDDSVKAYDMGDLAAQWFSDFLGRKLRLVRFDPEQRRLSSRKWTGEVEAENQFADGFPLLVVSQGALDELNGKLASRGGKPVTMARFRPNLVLASLDETLSAHGEDYLDELTIDTGEGLVRLRLVKPCVRCSIPNVEPATGEPGNEPGDTLSTYRADARMDGGLTFGMNAIILEGIEQVLRPGMKGTATLRF
jgi:uncharacterized protein YcbX